jgi:S-adenosylmethionine-diacylglycerol 3-amino-3-carboxypropyl transferase
MKNKLSGSKVFRDILYAQCWEDPEIDRIAFKINPEDIVFSITSGGCNALSFLIDDPKKIICLDLSRYQNYLLSLKINAFRALTHTELLEFTGVRPSLKRLELFEKIKPFLPEEEKSYWTTKLKDINRGIIHCGRYERYMHLLKGLFRIVIGRQVINELYTTESIEQRELLYAGKWNNFRWRIFCRIFLSRAFASMLFDKAFYRYLDPDFSFEKYYMSAVKRAVTKLPLYENHFLAYILLGNYYRSNFPVYLKGENYNLIRNRLDRIEIVTSACHDYFRSLPAGTISRFNFTNIFEWMSLQEFNSLLQETIRVAADGAVLTYRNHLVTRKRPESLADQIIPNDKLSGDLHEKDLSFIYKAYVVEQIRKKA